MAYADPNYDPQKAHEYYMKHRKLKGGLCEISTSESKQTSLKRIV